jgi:tetratricopeptide (TPR) repeat protein
MVFSPGAGENQIGSANMQTAAKNNLFLTRFPSIGRLGMFCQATNQAGFYQHISLALVRGEYKNQLSELANRLITIGDCALSFNHLDTVEQVSEILVNVPLLSEYLNVGRYYQAFSTKRRGRPDAARTIFERLAESPATPLRYRSRALQVIGAIYYESGNLDEALRFYLEAGCAALPKHGGDLLTTVQSQEMIAVLKSIEGDHRNSLADLEALFPFVRQMAPDHPYNFYLYANSFAVELAEAGRIKEARRFSRITLASPSLCAHPEWRETYDEIELKARRASRSAVSIGSISSHMVGDSSVGSEIIEPDVTPSNLRVFPSSRNRPAKASYNPFDKKLAPSELRWMTTAQKRSLILEIAQAVGIGDDVLDRMIKAAGVVEGEDMEPLVEPMDGSDMIASKSGLKPAIEPKGIALGAKGSLERLISLWVNGECGPDELAAVMSALRDCSDDVRRNDILDRMISYSFYETRECVESEAEWRKRVEALLTDDMGTD